MFKQLAHVHTSKNISNNNQTKQNKKRDLSSAGNFEQTSRMHGATLTSCLNSAARDSNIGRGYLCTRGILGHRLSGMGRGGVSDHVRCGVTLKCQRIARANSNTNRSSSNRAVSVRLAQNVALGLLVNSVVHVSRMCHNVATKSLTIKAAFSWGKSLSLSLPPLVDPLIISFVEALDIKITKKQCCLNQDITAYALKIRSERRRGGRGRTNRRKGEKKRRKEKEKKEKKKEKKSWNRWKQEHPFIISPFN